MSAAAVLDALRARQWRLATAESCTGGMIAAALTDIAGSSDVVECGFVTYSNAAKRSMLGVSAETLDAHGAVSEPVARQMADGARRRADTHIAIAVTGIAGPGGSDHKPEGRVCFAIAGPAGIVSETVEFGALGRAQVRSASVSRALELVLSAAAAPDP
ncbi:MAG: CinA family protein [Pseudomonadota bacterium]